MQHVIVIGGGIVGLSSAYYLRQAGYEVTLIDKNDLSDNCSYGNAGYVCPSHFIPLATPGIVKKGLRWMWNSRSPFYIQPRLSKSLISWGLQFMRSATPEHVRNAGVPLRDIAILSKKMYESWIGEPGFDFAYEQKGLLEIFQTDEAAHHAAEIVARAHELGLSDTALLSAAEVKALEPHIHMEAAGAIWFKCDAHLYPPKVMQQLIAVLKAQKVNFVLNEAVTDFDIRQQTIKAVKTDRSVYAADHVVLAAGSWSRELAEKIRLRMPLVGGRGYSITTEDPKFRINYPAVFVESRIALTPMDGNKTRFGGTMEITSTNTPPRLQRVQGIIDGVKRFYPEFDIPMPEPDKVWYGFRPCSADGLPYIGKAGQYKNFIVATGHSMLGMSLGAGTGKLVQELITGEPLSMDIMPFDPNRFA